MCDQVANRINVEISLYAPAVDIPMANPMPADDSTRLSWNRYDLNSGTGWGNCFGKPFSAV